MSRPRFAPGPAHAALGLLLLAAVAVACDEDGKALPAHCADPVMPIVDIANAGVPADDNSRYNDPGQPPCVTETGHGISFFGTAGSSTTSGGTGSGGKGGSGGTSKGGKAGSPNADAGAGGN